MGVGGSSRSCGFWIAGSGPDGSHFEVPIQTELVIRIGLEPCSYWIRIEFF